MVREMHLNHRISTSMHTFGHPSRMHSLVVNAFFVGQWVSEGRETVQLCVFRCPVCKRAQSMWPKVALANAMWSWMHKSAAVHTRTHNAMVTKWHGPQRLWCVNQVRRFGRSARRSRSGRWKESGRCVCISGMFDASAAHAPVYVRTLHALM